MEEGGRNKDRGGRREEGGMGGGRREEIRLERKRRLRKGERE